MAIFMINALVSLRRGKKPRTIRGTHAEFNKTLEWTVSSPPPEENFPRSRSVR
jgi:heme/copper-type cytochrome/quinol oxidase subunit 1